MNKIYIAPEIDLMEMASEDMIAESITVTSTDIAKKDQECESKSIDFSDDSDWGF